MWDDPRRLNILTGVITTLAVLVLLASAVSWTIRQSVFGIHRVTVVNKLTHVNPAHLEAVVREELRGTFFTMNLGRARAALQRVPWVRTIALRRHWPDRLEVSVIEHDALARWNDTALIDTTGEVFNADYDGELPLFEGPEGTASQVAERYADFSSALRPIGLSLTEIHLSPRGGWQLRTRSGLTLALGRNGALDRLTRFAAFHARSIARLERSGTAVDYVDLRYSNGFAVRVPGFKERAARKLG
jgi:cell division protein FtsQ